MAVRIFRCLMRSIQTFFGSAIDNSVGPGVEPLAFQIPSIAANAENAFAATSRSPDRLSPPAVAVASYVVDAEGRLPLPASTHHTGRTSCRDVTNIASTSRASSARRQQFSIAAAFNRIALHQTATMAHTTTRSTSTTTSHSYDISGLRPVNGDHVEDSMDFRRDTRRVQTLLVAAFLFPLLCIILQVTIVCLSGAIETDELPAIDDNGLTTSNRSLAELMLSSNCCWIAADVGNSTDGRCCLRFIKMPNSSTVVCLSKTFDILRPVLYPLALPCCSLVSGLSRPVFDSQSPFNRSGANTTNERQFYNRILWTELMSTMARNCSVTCYPVIINMNSSTYSTLLSADSLCSMCSLFNISLPTLCLNQSITFPSPNKYYNDPLIVVFTVTESLVVIVIAVSLLWFSSVVVVQFHRRQLPSLIESIHASRAHLDIVTSEQRRSDDLLGEMLPRWVAESLKHGRTVDPETFDEGTVYFSDIPGFHDTVNSCESPLEIVALLNAVFG